MTKKRSTISDPIVLPIALPPNRPETSFSRGRSTVYLGHSEDLYSEWPSPVCIISDGPYGLNGFPGDLQTVDGLVDWYRPHVEAWSEKSTPETTLWVWNSEIGWATIHPLLVNHEWEYRSCHIWNKGLGHIAGNANTRTLRKFPVTTEVCAQYVKQARFNSSQEWLTMKDWLRAEWRRSGLSLRLANDACGVVNAATRKYLTADHMWYYPPPKAFVRLAAYANQHGKPEGRPYFSIDGSNSIRFEQWGRMRAKFNCAVGITNVWDTPHVGGAERVNGNRQSLKWKFKSLHGSQKPLCIINIPIQASTEEGDVVWEPFGGLCPAAVCSWRMGRQSYSAEVIPEFYDAAVRRLACE